jgi:hypothetical protein
MTNLFVGDIDGESNILFLSDSQDVEAVRNLTNTHYDSYFVQISETGDIIAAYGMYGIVPLLEKSIFEIDMEG